MTESASEMPTIDCELRLTVGEMLIKLDCTCQPGAEYAATNALTEELRKRIINAHNRQLAGLPPVESDVPDRPDA